MGWELLSAWNSPVFAAERRDSGALELVSDTEAVIAFDVHRWLAPVAGADHSVVLRCRGPVLDVGCGPGRFVAALARRGIAALGVDIAHSAVDTTRQQGLPALRRDIFDELPGEGRWPTVLLIDGNIGIGGDPGRLLRRVLRLLHPGGWLIAEVDPRPDLQVSFTAQLRENGRLIGDTFEWAVVGADVVCAEASATGFAAAETWSDGGRSFVGLRR